MRCWLILCRILVALRQARILERNGIKRACGFFQRLRFVPCSRSSWRGLGCREKGTRWECAGCANPMLRKKCVYLQNVVIVSSSPRRVILHQRQCLWRFRSKRANGVGAAVLPRSRERTGVEISRSCISMKRMRRKARQLCYFGEINWVVWLGGRSFFFRITGCSLLLASITAKFRVFCLLCPGGHRNSTDTWCGRNYDSYFDLDDHNSKNQVRYVFHDVWSHERGITSKRSFVRALSRFEHFRKNYLCGCCLRKCISLITCAPAAIHFALMSVSFSGAWFGQETKENAFEDRHELGWRLRSSFLHVRASRRQDERWWDKVGDLFWCERFESCE